MPFMLKNVRSGRYLNLHTSTTGSTIPSACPFSVWDKTGSVDQIFDNQVYMGKNVMSLVRNSGYALNRHSSNNSCIAWPISSSSLRDSEYETVSSGGRARIRLVNHNLYLTAQGDSNGSMVYWMSSNTSNERQWWTFEDPGSFTYPTPSTHRALVRGYYHRSKDDYHYGLDVKELGNAPNIYAVADGTVAFTQSHSTRYWPGSPNNSMYELGNCVVINHINWDKSKKNYTYIRTLYEHLAAAPTLKAGDKVKKGQVVGKMGNTGRSQNTHLHFAMGGGNGESFKPGSTGWISYSSLNHFDPKLYFPAYN